MAHSYHEIAFTPTILEMQVEAGSRDGYAAMGGELRYANVLTAREVEFIAGRDSFYMASVSETGWPYVQHRGGPVGFMKVLDGRTIGFADYSGNRQYLSTGNFRHDDRVSLFFMDYPNRRRLKMHLQAVMPLQCRQRCQKHHCKLNLLLGALRFLNDHNVLR